MFKHFWKNNTLDAKGKKKILKPTLKNGDCLSKKWRYYHMSCFDMRCEAPHLVQQ